MLTIKGKNILITGGIGSITTKLLTGGGADVFITGRNNEKLQLVASENKIPAEKVFAADLSDPN